MSQNVADGLGLGQNDEGNLLPEEKNLQKVSVGDSISFSDETRKRIFSRHGMAVSIGFAGSLLQADGSRTVILDVVRANRSRMLFYSIGQQLPAKVQLRDITFTVTAVAEDGNSLEIEVP